MVCKPPVRSIFTVLVLFFSYFSSNSGKKEVFEVQKATASVFNAPKQITQTVVHWNHNEPRLQVQKKIWRTFKSNQNELKFSDLLLSTASPVLPKKTGNPSCKKPIIFGNWFSVYKQINWCKNVLSFWQLVTIWLSQNLTKALVSPAFACYLTYFFSNGSAKASFCCQIQPPWSTHLT